MTIDIKRIGSDDARQAVCPVCGTNETTASRRHTILDLETIACIPVGEHPTNTCAIDGSRYPVGQECPTCHHDQPRTDHGYAILKMRNTATNIRQMLPGGMLESLANDNLLHEVLMLEAAADLLEAHDATGISLDAWTGPLGLVQHALEMVNEGFTPNNV